MRRESAAYTWISAFVATGLRAIPTCNDRFRTFVLPSAAALTAARPAAALIGMRVATADTVSIFMLYRFRPLGAGRIVLPGHFHISLFVSAWHVNADIRIAEWGSD